VKHKNLISEETVLPRIAVSAAHGDVRSFTSSLQALWTYLLGIITWAELRECDGKLAPVVLSYDHCLVECRVSELIRLFVYLGLRMKVYDTVLHETFTVRGGMLGVSGVNTSACIVFACFWLAQTSRLTLDHELRSLTCYMGGDDFRLIFLGGTLGLHSHVWTRTKILVTKYIGTLSEEALEPIPIDSSREGGIYLRARFCKKLTYFYWIYTGSGIRLHGQSQFRIPLHRSMFKSDIPTHGPERDKLESFIADMVINVPWIQEQAAMIGTLYRALNTLHGPIPYYRRVKAIGLPPRIEMNDNETVGASIRVDNVVVPCSEHGPVTTDRDVVITWLTRCKRLRAFEYVELDSYRRLIHLPCESRLLTRLPGGLIPTEPPEASSAAHVCRLLVSLISVQKALSEFSLDT
jgi:hypothetical protein